MQNLKKFNSVDKNGNKLTVNETGYLTLRLKEKGRTLKIGRIFKNSKGRTVYKKREAESNLFRKTQAWGLNAHVIETLDEKAGLIVKTEKGTYKILVKKAKIHGQYFNFKQSGRELQFFIPVACWKFTEG